MKKTLILFLSSIVVLIAASSCDKSKKFEKEEQATIDAFLSTSSLNFERKPSGLYYHEVVAGTGRIAVKFDTAYLKYTGKFLDGRTFDTNVGSPNTLDVVVGTPGLIEGFAEGITYMAQGGKSVLLVPSYLGYGSIGIPYAGISGFTPLLFEVQLVRLKAGPGK
jgi:FKBP-type peptidyl-prolyl cis-trans isomerase